MLCDRQSNTTSRYHLHAAEKSSNSQCLSFLFIASALGFQCKGEESSNSENLSALIVEGIGCNIECLIE